MFTVLTLRYVVIPYLSVTRVLDVASFQLLGMVSKPVKAVILLFPISKALEDKRKIEDAEITDKSHPAIDPTVFWIKQTVSITP